MGGQKKQRVLVTKSLLNSYQSYDEESDYDEADDWLRNLITFIDIAKMEKNLTTERKNVKHQRANNTIHVSWQACSASPSDINVV